MPATTALSSKAEIPSSSGRKRIPPTLDLIQAIVPRAHVGKFIQRQTSLFGIEQSHIDRPRSHPQMQRVCRSHRQTDR
jgi:hypothetical protein